MKFIRLTADAALIAGQLADRIIGDDIGAFLANPECVVVDAAFNPAPDESARAGRRGSPRPQRNRRARDTPTRSTR